LWLRGFVLGGGCHRSVPCSGPELWLRDCCEGTGCMGSVWWVLEEAGVWEKECLSETLVS